jgi:hypothetical protein
MRRDELMPKTIATYHPGVRPRREDQPIVRPQQERAIDTSQATEACDQRLLQRRRCRRRSAAARELPAEQLSDVAVDDQR